MKYNSIIVDVKKGEVTVQILLPKREAIKGKNIESLQGYIIHKGRCSISKAMSNPKVDYTKEKLFEYVSYLLADLLNCDVTDLPLFSVFYPTLKNV